MTTSNMTTNSPSGRAEAPNRYEVHPNAAWRSVDDHIFVITPDNRQHELEGDVESVVWQACSQAPQSIDALVALVVERFEVDRELAVDDLTEFVSTLVVAGLLRPAAGP